VLRVRDTEKKLLARIARIIISLGISIVPLLYIAGYLSFIPGLPSPSSLFGANLTGGSQNGIFGVGTGFGSLIPFGTFGVSGLIIFTLLSRIGSTVSSAVNRTAVPNMRSYPGMAGFLGSSSAGQLWGGIPEALPQDLTKSQYVILRLIRGGQTKTGDIAKGLSMEKNDVTKAVDALKANGYLSGKNKLTTKGLDVLS
jgi:hypothetical protein